VWFISPETIVLGVRLLNIGLGLIMFGMGITLRVEDFWDVLNPAIGGVVASIWSRKKFEDDV